MVAPARTDVGDRLTAELRRAQQAKAAARDTCERSRALVASSRKSRRLRPDAEQQSAERARWAEPR